MLNLLNIDIMLINARRTPRLIFVSIALVCCVSHCNGYFTSRVLHSITMGSNRQRASGRPSLDDVERISFGKAAKKRGTGSRGVCHRLNEEERAEWNIAKRKGYLVLRGTGYRKERKGSPLNNIFRQFCDAKCTPFVCVEQGLGIDGVDHVRVDLSPLRQKDIASTIQEIESLCAEAGATKVIENLLEEQSPLEDVLEIVDDEALANDVIWRLPAVELVYSASTRKDAKALAEKIFTYWTAKEWADAVHA